MANKYVSLNRLSNFLDQIKAKYSQIGHKHVMSDITDYKEITVITNTEIDAICGTSIVKASEVNE